MYLVLLPTSLAQHSYSYGQGGARGATSPQNFAWTPQWPPKIFRVRHATALKLFKAIRLQNL